MLAEEHVTELRVAEPCPAVSESEDVRALGRAEPGGDNDEGLHHRGTPRGGGDRTRGTLPCVRGGGVSRSTEPRVHEYRNVSNA